MTRVPDGSDCLPLAQCECTEDVLCSYCRARRNRIERIYGHIEHGISFLEGETLDVGSDIPGGGAA